MQNNNGRYIQNKQQNTPGHLTKDIKESDRMSGVSTRNNVANLQNQTNTPRTIRATRYPERASDTENTVKTNGENNAVRVPYRATNI